MHIFSIGDRVASSMGFTGMVISAYYSEYDEKYPLYKVKTDTLDIFICTENELTLLG